MSDTAIAELQQRVQVGRRQLRDSALAWAGVAEALEERLAELRTLSSAAAEPLVRLTSWAAETRDALYAADQPLQEYSARLAGKE